MRNTTPVPFFDSLRQIRFIISPRVRLHDATPLSSSQPRHQHKQNLIRVNNKQKGSSCSTHPSVYRYKSSTLPEPSKAKPQAARTQSLKKNPVQASFTRRPRRQPRRIWRGCPSIGAIVPHALAFPLGTEEYMRAGRGFLLRRG